MKNITYPSNSQKISGTSKGFTLVEVLAATSIMVVVILLVLGLTTNVLSSWNRASGQLSSNFEARVALDQIAKELETIRMLRNDKVLLQVDYEPVTGSGVPDKVQDQPRLMFFADAIEQPTLAGSGDNQRQLKTSLCALQYRVHYKEPFANSGGNSAKVFGLYRSIVDAENTFKGPWIHSSNTADAYLSSYWDNDGSWGGETPKAIDENGTEVSGAAFAKWADDQSNLLSINIVDFSLVFWYQDPSGQMKALTNDETGSGTPLSFYYWNGIYQGNTLIPGTLEYADISLTVMTDEGAKILNAIANGYETGGVEFEDIVNQYSRVSSRRVHFVADPF